MDGLSDDPKEIPVLINLLDKHEFVIGSGTWMVKM